MRWVVLAMLLVIGCQAQPVQMHHADRLGQLSKGIGVDRFQDVFPEAYVGGRSEDTVAYVLRDRQFDFWDGTQTQWLHFYFEHGQLVQWGTPGSWESDVEMTIRHQ